MSQVMYEEAEQCGPASSRRCATTTPVIPAQLVQVAPCGTPIGAQMAGGVPQQAGRPYTPQQLQQQQQLRQQQQQQMVGRKMGTPTGTNEGVMRSNSASAPNATTDLDLNNHRNHLTAKFYAKWQFSLAEAAKNPGVLISRPNPDIFLKTDRATGQASGDLSRAIVFDVRVEKFSNRSLIDLGVKIDILNQHIETTTPNSAVNLVMLAGEISSEKQSILRSEKMLSAILVAQFGHHTVQSITKALTLVRDEVTGEPSYYVVPQNHIVVQLIGYNTELLGVNPANYKPHNGRYDIEASIVDLVVKKVNEQVLQKIPYKDLRQFALALTRPDGFAWDDARGISGITGSSSSFADESNVVSAVVSVRYSFMDGKGA